MIAIRSRTLCLADFDGSGRRDVCVSFGVEPGPRRVVILDARGQKRASRDLTADSLPALKSADIDGNGRDELLFHDGDRLCACRGDLTELWSLPTRDPIREVLPSPPGRAATVVLSPSLGLDGATGRPIWSIGSVRSILRASDDKSLPRALDGPDGATVCRVAMPTMAEGILPVQGLAARPAALRDDPRWQRPLPWVGRVEPYANPLVQLAMGATLINVCIPLAILWLATRRRFWSVRLLLALPAMVAFPLVGFSVAISLIPDRPQPTVPPWWLVPLGIAMWSMSGLPIVVYTVALGSALVRRRWWRMGLLVAGTMLAAILIGAIMLWSDGRAKPSIEHYNWSGRHQVVYLGAYAVGALALSGAIGRGVTRLVSRLTRRRSRRGIHVELNSDEPSRTHRSRFAGCRRARGLIGAGSGCWPGYKSNHGSARNSTRRTSCNRRFWRRCAIGPSFAAAARPSWRPGCGRFCARLAARSAPLWRRPAARRRPRGLAGAGAGRVFEPAGKRAGGPWLISQRASRPPRAGAAAGRCAGAAPGRLRRDHPHA